MAPGGHWVLPTSAGSSNVSLSNSCLLASRAGDSPPCLFRAFPRTNNANSTTSLPLCSLALLRIPLDIVSLIIRLPLSCHLAPDFSRPDRHLGTMAAGG